MIKLKTKVLVDLGNSQTRAILVVKNRRISVELSNKFAVLPEQYVVDSDYRNNRTSVFVYEGDYIANGEIVDVEFSDKYYRPAGFNNKSEQIVTSYTISLLLIRAISLLSGDMGMRPEDIEWHFTIAVLLPPFEHDTKRALMEKRIADIKEVSAFLPTQFRVPIFLDKVLALPEGIVAYTTAMFMETNGVLHEVEENAKFKQGYVVIIDIGAGTTDLAVVKNGKFMLSTKESFLKGGNTVESECRKNIRRKYNFSPSDMQTVISRGIVVRGNEVIDVSDILDNAKMEYARSIMLMITEYLEGVSVPVREIKGILLVGGGSLSAVNDGKVVSAPMSEPLLKVFRELSPSAELVSLHGVNPRMANIEGLSIMATQW